MNARFDLIVIGGGPAGSAAAITAARLGHRVALLERGSFPRHKVCGEFVSAEALTLLKRLLGASAHVSSHPAISHARVFIDGKIRHLDIAPAAVSIPRLELDAALWKAAKNDGVDALESETVNGISGNGPFRVSTDSSEYVTRAVINASGRWSSIGGGLTPSPGAQLGLKAHFREDSPPQSVDLYFFAGGYCGVQPIGPDSINVSAMVSPAVAKSLDDVFQLEPALRARSQAWSPVMHPISTYPLIFCEPMPIDAERSIFNAGDASGFIDPFVGDGISMALHSGIFAAVAACKFLDGSCSLREAALSYDGEYRHRLSPAFRNAARIRKLIATPPLRSVAMELFRLPMLSRLAVRSTRARSA